jgi:hypothetical protein
MTRLGIPPLYCWERYLEAAGGPIVSGIWIWKPATELDFCRLTDYNKVVRNRIQSRAHALPTRDIIRHRAEVAKFSAIRVQEDFDWHDLCNDGTVK